LHTKEYHQFADSDLAFAPWHRPVKAADRVPSNGRLRPDGTVPRGAQITLRGPNDGQSPHLDTRPAQGCNGGLLRHAFQGGLQTDIAWPLAGTDGFETSAGNCREPAR